MNDKSYKNELMELFYRKSKENGLKITPQRIAIYQEFLKAKDHPSADNIYKKLVKKIPNISFDTVHRTLLMFSTIGMLILLKGMDNQKGLILTLLNIIIADASNVIK